MYSDPLIQRVRELDLHHLTRDLESNGTDRYATPATRVGGTMPTSLA